MSSPPPQSSIEMRLSVHPLHFYGISPQDTPSALCEEVVWDALCATADEIPSAEKWDMSVECLDAEEPRNLSAELSIMAQQSALLVVKKGQYTHIALAEVSLLFANVSLAFNASSKTPVVIVKDPLCPGMLKTAFGMSKQSSDTWVFGFDGTIAEANELLRDFSARGSFCKNMNELYSAKLQSLSRLTPKLCATRKLHAGRILVPERKVAFCRESMEESDVNSRCFVRIIDNDETSDVSGFGNIAFKVLNGNASVLEAVVRREVGVLSTIGEHPNVAQFFGAFSVSSSGSPLASGGESCWALAMASSSRSLATDVAEEAIPETKCAEIAASMLGALRHIHGRGVVHRGVEPSAVLHLPCGRFVLSGFNFAVRESEREELSRPCVQMPFVAPEVSQRLVEDCSGKMDVYSLGVSMYFALSGVSRTRRRSIDLSAPQTRLLSNPCKALLMLTTCCNPKRRPTAEAALYCEWLGVGGYSDVLPSRDLDFSEKSASFDDVPIASPRTRGPFSCKRRPGSILAGSALGAVREIRRDSHLGSTRSPLNPQPPASPLPRAVRQRPRPDRARFSSA